MRTAAILPVKRFSDAKQRLGASVADPLRRDLARAMVGDVLSALRDCVELERTIVVTCEQSVAAAARYLGAIVIPDTDEESQSIAVAQGIERAAAEGFERVLCVPGDCPALDPAEVAALLEAPPSDAAEVVIVPDRHGTGTNGLLLAPPDAITPSFGPSRLRAPPPARARGRGRSPGGAAALAAARHRHRRGPRRAARTAGRGTERRSAPHPQGAWRAIAPPAPPAPPAPGVNLSPLRRPYSRTTRAAH